jgi:hypothetical protein
METAIATATENKATGYAVKTVVARIVDMDVDAIGNGEKAAWKRYTVLALLAMAKGVDKKALINEVFGKGNKPSKTFQNMWSLADKARTPMLGNYKWSDIAVMPIEEAIATALGMLNRHMATLDVTSKNEYDRFATSSPDEVKATREREAAAKAEEAKAKDEAEAKAKEDKAEKEEKAKDKADATPERTAAQAAIGALIDASRDDLMQVAAHIVTRIGMDDIRLMHEALTAMLANDAAAKAKDITPATTIEGKAA